MLVTKDSFEYKYILSLLDIFSPFLELRLLCSKDFNEVMMYLKGIYGDHWPCYGVDNGSSVFPIFLIITSKVTYQYSSEKLHSVCLKIFFSMFKDTCLIG